MLRLPLFTALLVAGVLGALPAGAAAQTNFPLVGFGEQRPGIFDNKHWNQLGLKDVRLVVGWDALRYKWQRREIDHWMHEARDAQARVLVAFTRSRAHWRKRKLPTADEYQTQFLHFRERYPDVEQFITWNEANHCSQPTCERPDMAAKYFDVISDACPYCTVVAADVLDTSRMVDWLHRFKAAAEHTPTVWGLHNYIDANRFRTTGTEAMLAAVNGTIWFTETGGLVKRPNTSPIKFPDSPTHAAKATNWLFDHLVPLSPRIKRVYLYHWQNQGPQATWDSGMLDPKGRPRPAYSVLAKFVARAQKARKAHAK
jgi:hypothetical protein